MWLLAGDNAGSLAEVEGYEKPPPRALVRVRLSGERKIDIVDEEALVVVRAGAPTNALERLEDWYLSQSDGDWEHGYGVTIGTLDNPGWSLSIDLAETDLADVHFARVEHHESEHRWWMCWKEDRTFKGVGGPQMLGRLIEVFIDWVQASQ